MSWTSSLARSQSSNLGLKLYSNNSQDFFYVKSTHHISIFHSRRPVGRWPSASSSAVLPAVRRFWSASYWRFTSPLLYRSPTYTVVRSGRPQSCPTHRSRCPHKSIIEFLTLKFELFFHS